MSVSGSSYTPYLSQTYDPLFSQEATVPFNGE